MKDKARYAIITAALALLLAALACYPPQQATEIPTAASQADVGTEPPDATDVSVPTDTPVPDVAGPGECTFNATFVKDVTIPDGTSFSPGAPFVKVWRMRNSGTCTWETGTELVFSSGEQMGGPADVPVTTPVTPGGEVDISVDLTAPNSPGTYQGKWQLRNAKGTFFGNSIWVKIVVPAPATNTPTKTPTPLPGPMCTPPACPAGQVAICAGLCTGGCGMVCVTPTPGCMAVDPVLKPISDYATSQGYDLGCATAAAFPVAKDGGTGAYQEFWANWDNPNPHTHYRSLMIWRADNREIYVIVGEDTDGSKGTLMAYTDTWVEGQPAIHPDCAGMTPPAGYQLPVRGFGKVWCVNDLEDDVGWPTTAEVQVNLYVQPMQFGLLLKVTGPSVGRLIALDYRAVRGVTQFIAP